MKILNGNFNLRRFSFWIIEFFAFIWILLRTGANPKRLTYPCQQAAFPLASSWLLAIAAFFSASLILRKFVKLSSAVILIAGVFWFIGTVPEFPRAEVTTFNELPVWEVNDPVSSVFVMDKVPPTSGFLAAGDASVPDEYLSDPAIDTLLAMMETKGIFLHKTATQTSGIVGADNILIIKGNFQWTSRNTTSTDRIKGLIWQILQHPDGFSGEIIICVTILRILVQESIKATIIQKTRSNPFQIGVLTTANASQRHGGWNAMHYQYFFGQYALVARVMAVTYPKLVILDAAWTSTPDPNVLTGTVNTKMLLASTDPIAVSWYAVKYI